MKKIIIYVPFFSFLSHYGGAENQAQKLSAELCKLGVKFKFITTENIPNSRNIQSNSDFEVIKLPFLYKGENSLLRKISTFIYLAELFIYLAINYNKYDILQNFQLDKHSFITTLCGLLFNKPVILREANVKKADDSKENIHKSFFQKNSYKLYSKASAFIALSPEIENEFINDYNFNPDKIHLIPNGIEAASKKDKDVLRKNLNLPSDKFISICVGRLFPQKNHILLFNAWIHLIKQLPDALLICLGDGSEREKYERFISENNCQNNIILAGNVDNVQEYLQSADLFVLTSFYEGMSNAIIEAMSCSLPCIVSDIEANRFLIQDNHNGLLFNLNESPENLAKLILHLRQNPKKMMELGEQAMLSSKNFSIEESARKYFELYNDLGNGIKISDILR